MIKGKMIKSTQNRIHKNIQQTPESSTNYEILEKSIFQKY